MKYEREESVADGIVEEDFLNFVIDQSDAI